MNMNKCCADVQVTNWSIARRARISISVMAVAVLLADGHVAMAQQAAPVANDIVVTASRGGGQRLQSIPMAVSAISAESLTRQGVDDLASIVKSVPSVNVTERAPGQSQITIRGISAGSFSMTETGDRPLVSVYLDDTPIPVQGANPDLKVYDLERVEVLRGPQGTLYGSGSMAGTIRYITVKPSTKKMYGSVEGNVGTTAHAKDPNWNGRASINIPLSQDLAFLESAYTGRAAGRRSANSNSTTQACGALRFALHEPDESDCRCKPDLRSFQDQWPSGGLFRDDALSVQQLGA